MHFYSYFFSYLLPLCVILSVWLQGFWIGLPLFFIFFITPCLDLILGQKQQIFGQEQLEKRRKHRCFDIPLYLYPFIQTVILLSCYQHLAQGHLNMTKTIFIAINLGLMVGAVGINIAHELGHRATRWEQFLAQWLLAHANYTHFSIDHVYGHHVDVATTQDPTTARKNQSLYSYLPQSIIGSFWRSIKMERRRLEKKGKPFLCWKNKWLSGQALTLAIHLFLFLNFGVLFNFVFMIQSATAIFLLETINYIEHYGLLRDKNASGHYLKVGPEHSWNSDFMVSNLFLFNLQLHSHHHQQASRPYQVLQSMAQAPQLPFGYPIMVKLALIPPLFFRSVNPRLPH